MKNQTPLILSAASALLLLATPTLRGAGTATEAASASAQNNTVVLAKQSSGAGAVTSTGFEDRIAVTTLYMEIPIEGVIGVDLTPESVHRAMEAADDDKHINHVVFMIDVDPNLSRGALLDKDIVGGFNDLEIHALVRTGLNFGVFPIFFSDNIFMTEDAVVGNMPIHLMMPPGDDQVMAKLVGIYTSQLASGAETHGHNPDIVRAMIDENRDLYYWREDGEVVVSGDQPSNPDSVQSFEKIQSLTYGGNLTLDQETAIRIKLAEHIDDYDAYALGELLEIESWEAANHFGMIANEIGLVLAEITPIAERVEEIDKQVPDIRVTRDNRNNPEVREIADFKRSLDQAASGLALISDGLHELLEIHPERHAYFMAENGQTILADPEQWQEDVEEASQLLGRMRSGMTQLRAALIKAYQDPDLVDPIGAEIERIQEHVEGIKEHGNAAYWEDHYVPELPPDIVG